MTTNNDWEVFKKIGYNASQMALTVYKTGQFSLTVAVCDKLNSDYIHLMYNKRTKNIGFESVSKDTLYAYKLQIRQRQTARVLYAAPFIRYYKLEHIKGKRFPVKVRNGLFVVDLSDAI